MVFSAGAPELLVVGREARITEIRKLPDRLIAQEHSRNPAHP